MEGGLDLGLAARPAGYMPASKTRVAIPVRENCTTNLRTQKQLDVKSSGGLKSFRVADAASRTSPEVVKKPKAEQIFRERVDLVSHWFDLWTVRQRKRFLLEMFGRCGQSELDFVQAFSDSALAAKRRDFTSVLPAFLSKYIFSLLDPKSLSRAAQVSSHWRMLSESDQIWTCKCIRHGWFLQYSPSSLENGAWKRHYIRCTHNMVPGKPTPPLQGAHPSDLFSHVQPLSQLNTPRTARSARSRSRSTSRVDLEDRPKWQDPDKKPKEISQNPFETPEADDVERPTSAFLYSTRWGVSSFTQEKGYGLEDPDRLGQHPIGGELEVSQEQTGTLGDLMQAERAAEGSADLKETPWHYPEKQDFDNRFGEGVDVLDTVDCKSKDLMEQQLNYPNHSSPRVILLSSRLPAKELLHHSVMYGVIGLLYEYEGTTLQTLIALIKHILKGRKARSVGIFTDGRPGEVWLTRDATVSLDTVGRDDIQRFWLDLSAHLLPPASGAHVDLFTPLAACDSGLELMFQLNLLTGLKFTSPISMVRGLGGAVAGEWAEQPEGVRPVSHYFQTQKVATWAATASRVQEAVHAVNSFLQDYFTVERRALLSELTGKVVFDALSLSSVRVALVEVLPAVIDALNSYRHTGKQGKEPPLKFVAEFLARRQEEAQSGGGMEKQDQSKEEDEWETDLLLMSKFGRERALRLLSTSHIRDEPDRRATVAVELLSSELEYMRTLGVLTELFMSPLRATLEAGNPIIGVGNIHALFADIQCIAEISKSLLKEVTNKVDNWTSDSTLADVLIKFTAKSKAYTNYVNNYPGVMRIFDKLVEENPAFRAFIAAVEHKPNTKMLSFHELYMTPTRRVNQYILLMQALQINTPASHPDKLDLSVAVEKLEALQTFMEQHRKKLERDAAILRVEEKIVNCPRLLEGNRTFLREDSASLMKQHQPQEDGAAAEYSHVQDVALFTFSDALLVCVVRSRHEPFQRVVRSRVLFSTCLSLAKLRLEVLPDSKFIQHAIRLSTRKAEWVLKLANYRSRVTFVHTLEAAIRALVQPD